MIFTKTNPKLSRNPKTPLKILCGDVPAEHLCPVGQSWSLGCRSTMALRGRYRWAAPNLTAEEFCVAVFRTLNWLSSSRSTHRS